MIIDALLLTEKEGENFLSSIQKNQSSAHFLRYSERTGLSAIIFFGHDAPDSECLRVAKDRGFMEKYVLDCKLNMHVEIKNPSDDELSSLAPLGYENGRIPVTYFWPGVTKETEREMSIQNVHNSQVLHRV